MRKGERIFWKRGEERLFWKGGGVRSVEVFWEMERGRVFSNKKLLEKKGKEYSIENGVKKEYSGKWREEEYSRKEIKNFWKRKGKKIPWKMGE